MRSRTVIILLAFLLGVIHNPTASSLELAPDKFEPNNSFDLATNLGDSSVSLQNLTIFPFGDVDYFLWMSPDKGQFQADIFFTDLRNGKTDLDLQLLDANMQSLKLSDGIRDDESITHEASVGDKFFLRVFGVQNDENEYDLRITPPSKLGSDENPGQTNDNTDTGQTPGDSGGGDGTTSPANNVPTIPARTNLFGGRSASVLRNTITSRSLTRGITRTVVAQTPTSVAPAVPKVVPKDDAKDTSDTSPADDTSSVVSLVEEILHAQSAHEFRSLFTNRFNTSSRGFGRSFSARAPIPEPSSAVLAIVGGLMVASYRSRRRSH